MKLALDVSPLLHGATGISTYVSSLVAARAHLHDEVAVGFAAGRGAGELSVPGLRMATTATPRRILDRLWLGLGRDHVERITGPIDVFHATDLLAPRTRAAAVVLTVHDLAWKTQPELADPRIAARLEQHFARALDVADRIIAVSRATARDLAAVFGVAEDRITVVHHGVWPSYHPGAVDWARLRDPDAARLGGGYLLAVGPVDRRKDLASLVAAHRRLERAPPLVIVGPDAGGEEQLAAALEGTEPGRVLRLGRVSERRLARLYRGATALVYPSRAEGFGLPVLEGLASGVPVVSTEVPAVTEVAGDAVWTVPIGDVDALAGAIDALLADPAAAAGRVARGIERASTRSWVRCAAETDAVYASAHEVRNR